ncbi:MAG: isoprenylcysteine carboxylmethyltransferase family protein [Abditibacteriales bacterium]|nr:isoprenylcysteine carboxylmethyltransferase family protein [Abditibacteriales bacterium]MDW8366718.1 isoprenylcysteine carboxylmethyltransferase family protein [Abditibacteriales bacterium]
MNVPRQSFITRHRTHLTLLACLALFGVSVWWRHSIGKNAPPLLFWTGAGLVAAGQLLRLWAAGYLRKDEQVVTGGPFRYLRHPLYVGSFTAAVGYCLMSGLLLSLLLVPPFFIAAYYPAVIEEETFLTQKFGDAYRAYCARVPRFLPRLRNAPAFQPADRSKFAWQLVKRNKEYEAVVGNLILVGLFIAVCR